MSQLSITQKETLSKILRNEFDQKETTFDRAADIYEIAKELGLSNTEEMKEDLIYENFKIY